jgi:hypothetical protein
MALKSVIPLFLLIELGCIKQPRLSIVGCCQDLFSIGISVFEYQVISFDDKSHNGIRVLFEMVDSFESL